MRQQRSRLLQQSTTEVLCTRRAATDHPMQLEPLAGALRFAHSSGVMRRISTPSTRDLPEMTRVTRYRVSSPSNTLHSENATQRAENRLLRRAPSLHATHPMTTSQANN